MKKKHSLTLLEVIIAIVLLGFVLTSLFNIFHQTLKKNISSRQLKQTVVLIELFEQKIKHLLSLEESLWIDEHPEAIGQALFTRVEQTSDPDFALCGEILTMLFLNDKKQLCFAQWRGEENARCQILLDKVDLFKCEIFDSKKKEWYSNKSQGENPAMVKINITWNKQEIPFVFFLSSSHDKILYSEYP